MLRGEPYHAWHDEGQKKLQYERSVSIKFNQLMFTATYQPVHYHNFRAEIDRAKDDLKVHKEWARGDNVVVIGGDFNAHVGGGNKRDKICSNFGLRKSNHQGEELLQFCEEKGLAYCNSFYNSKLRGTWYNNFNGQWEAGWLSDVTEPKT